MKNQTYWDENRNYPNREQILIRKIPENKVAMIANVHHGYFNHT